MAAPVKSGLSPRHIEVLALIAEGNSDSEIGGKLFITKDTVKTHNRRIYKLLGARDRAHAVALAYRRGILGKGPQNILRLSKVTGMLIRYRTVRRDAPHGSGLAVFYDAVRAALDIEAPRAE